MSTERRSGVDFHFMMCLVPPYKYEALLLHKLYLDTTYQMLNTPPLANYLHFQRGRKNFYDETGCIISTGRDLCDCLIEDCPGCFYPCENCRSLKCGKECRVNRRWHYISTEVEEGPARTFPQLPLPSNPNCV